MEEKRYMWLYKKTEDKVVVFSSEPLWNPVNQRLCSSDVYMEDSELPSLFRGFVRSLMKDKKPNTVIKFELRGIKEGPEITMLSNFPHLRTDDRRACSYPAWDCIYDDDYRHELKDPCKTCKYGTVLKK